MTRSTNSLANSNHSITIHGQDEKTRKILIEAISVIGIILLTASFFMEIFFSGLDKWLHSLLGILGVAFILGHGLLRRWGRNKSLATKTMIIITSILLVLAVLITPISRQDTFLIGFVEGIMLVAIVIYIILFFWVEYKGE